MLKFLYFACAAFRYQSRRNPVCRRLSAAAIQDRGHIVNRAIQMKSQQELVEYLKLHDWLESQNCIDAMSRTDRKDFVAPGIPRQLFYMVRTSNNLN
jgi:hypothetical protein